MIMTNSTRESRHRKFIRDIFPFHGQQIAASTWGFTPPSVDGQVAELKESFKLWQQVAASGSEDAITDASWWMTRIMDPKSRASMTETLAQHTQLTAFAVGVIGQLLASGAIKWADEDMELPEIEVQSPDGNLADYAFSEDEEIDLDRLLSDLGLDGEDYDE